MLQPSSLPLGIRSIEWLRGHGGAWLVNDVERLYYGFSVLHCLPVGMAEPDSAGTGTVIRPHTVREYAAKAGFVDVQVLPIEHDLWRFYLLNA